MSFTNPKTIQEMIDIDEYCENTKQELEEHLSTKGLTIKQLLDKKIKELEEGVDNSKKIKLPRRPMHTYGEKGKNGRV